MTKDVASATGSASQTPFIRQKYGKIISAAETNKNVRQNDKTADTLPLEYAVNKADAKMFIPINKKQGANRRLPVKADS